MKKSKSRKLTVLLLYPEYMCDGVQEHYCAQVIGCGENAEDQLIDAADKARKMCLDAQADGSGVDYDPKDFAVHFVMNGWVDIVADLNDEL